MTPPPRDLFLQSLERCKKDDTFMDAFYKRFLATSTEVANKFRYTDFERQHRMVVESLEISARATEGDHEALQALHKQATLHSRKHLDIRPELYQHWLDAILTTAAEVDPLWDEQVGTAWRTILQHVINYMTSKY